MHSIPIPDPLYIEVHRIAGANGLSIEKFVTDAVELHLHDDLDEPENVILTPQQVAIIRRSQADIKAGKGMQIDQVKTELIANRAAWLQANPN